MVLPLSEHISIQFRKYCLEVNIQEVFFLKNKGNIKEQALAGKSEEIKDKYTEMEQRFEAVKKEAFEPQIERLGETKGEQNQRTQV